MFNVFIIAEQNDQIQELAVELVQKGLSCSLHISPSEAIDRITGQAPNLALVAIDGPSTNSESGCLSGRLKRELGIPVIALVSRQAIDSLDPDLDIDDFIVEPWDAAEVAVRAKRVLWRTKGVDGDELIRCGDLIIDLGKCEVSLCGSLVALTFREYELLRFMASNKERVCTREVLLNKVWGYDYYGGDRTVDVHIRRLRSKIEDKGHSFIETVRNIGYRFKESA